jgi:hypothetical protein
MVEQRDKDNTNKAKMIFSTNDAEKIGHLPAKNVSRPRPTVSTKINSK